ncbi:MAG: hypothetical protein K0R52_836 [Alphaproteobacteria bacterium]|jgi:hypothetical protein|nr:hypothetical protein [Alphaproteobacteria bacterium]
MTTYFAWHPAEESFDPQTHRRCDLEILALTIDHREGEVAIATVVVVEPRLPPLDQRHAFISYDHRLIFSGRLVGLPVKITPDLVSLEFTAEPLDAAAQLQGLACDLKQAPFWDVAFVDPAAHNNPAEWLEARSALFAWDRLTGQVSVSDLFQGRCVLDVTDVFFADSLKVSLAETPLSHISVTLTAEWVQEASGEVSLGRKIAAAFPGGMINTLTPHALEATWFKEGQKLGRSGFWVVESHLNQVTPPRTGVLDVYPTLTPEVMTGDELTQAPKTLRAKRFWMSGTVVLGWRYRQKRREVVQVTVSQKTQLDGAIRPLTRTLHLHLQQVAPAVGSTFFLTSRGRQAVDHALEVARAHLAASARCLEIEICLPFEAGLALSMDHSVCLVDARIPGGRALGKVVAYSLRQDGLKACAWVRFAASIGAEPERTPFPETTFYAEPAYGDTGMPPYHQTASGLVYASYAHQRPQEGMIEGANLSVHDLVKDVFVSHDAERQIQALQSQQYPVRQNIKSVLEEVPTVISLDLADLRTQGVVEHVIQLQTIGLWTAPCQVDVSGGLP